MSILDLIDIKFLISSLSLTMKEHHSYFLGKCPFHDDKTPSFSIHKQGYYKCFSCSETGSLNKLVYKLTGKSIYKFFNIKDINSFHFESSINYKKDDKKRDSFEVKDIEIKGNLLDIKDSDNELLNEYVRKRNLDDYFIEYFDIKYCNYCIVNGTEFRNRIMIPLYENGRLIGYEGRDFTKKQSPKVLYNKGSNVSSLFNVDNLDWKRPLILVEGTMDLPLIFLNVTENCTHTYGCNFSNRQRALINKFEEVIYFMDNDPAGEKAAIELDNFYEKEFWIAKPLKEGTDPGDLSLNEIKECLDKKIKAIDYFLDRSGLFENKEIIW